MTDKTTLKVLQSMMTESTGMSFLDSGGTPKYDSQGNYLGSTSGYGRHYERNKGVDFTKTARVSLSFKWDYPEYTKNVFWYLADHLTYNGSLTRSLMSFSNKPEFEYDNWLDIVIKWLKYQKSKKHDVTGLYGDGFPSWDNSYNSENNLSQDIQFCYFELDNTGYVALQLHNGADARGGYTSPKIFESDESIFLYSDGSIFCENDHLWSTDDSYHWYPDDRKIAKDLREYEYLSMEEWKESDDYKNRCENELVIPEGQLGFIPDYHPEVINPVSPPKGIILYDADGNGFCPICGAKLYPSG